MHELALCQSVVETVREQARIHGFGRVSAVRLEIGALSCVSAEAIDFCFSAVSRGTVADGARLELIRVPGQACCLDCGSSTMVQERHDACGRCGGHRLRIVQGEEMRIKDLEVP
jgi:hydrogenase nickel incorporation protein HypA/HybF